VSSINPNGKPPTKPEDFNKNTQVPAGEVLSMIGIDGKFAGHGWRVDSVRKNSKAEHLGLKAGDVVEAINDRKLAEKTGFESGFEGKTLRVIRDGKPVQVQIKP